MHKIDILMPVYNAESYLEESLHGIFSQTFQDFRIIAVDDASDDKSSEILKSFKNERLTSIQNPFNMGCTASLQKGFSMCQAEFTARIDADDIMKPERLEVQMNFLMDHPEYSVVGSNADIIDEASRLTGEMNWLHDDYDIICNLLKGFNPVGHPLVMFKTEEIRKVGAYNSPFKASQDMALWLNLYASGRKCGNIPQSLTQYRVHSKQISQTARAGEKERWLHMFSSFLNSIFPAHGFSQTEIADYLDFHTWKDRIFTTEQSKKYNMLFEKILIAFERHSFMLAPVSRVFAEKHKDASAVWKKRLQWILKEFKEEKLQYAVYGAGRKGREILDFISQENLMKPIVAFDDNPTETSYGEFTISKLDAKYDTIGAIVLGTDSFQDKLRLNAHKTFRHAFCVNIFL